MNSTLRSVVVTAIPAACIAGALALTFAGDTDAAAPDEAHHAEQRSVAVAVAEQAPPSREHVAFGLTASADRALVAFTLPGRLESRAVEVGDVVQAGDEIARLDDAPFRNQSAATSAQIDDLEAQIDDVSREQNRVEQLLEAELGTGQSLDQLQTANARLAAGLSAARAEHREARRQLRETTLTAPFDGVIADVFVDAGELTAAGSPIALLTAMDGIEIEVEVPESVFIHVREGDAVTVRFPMSERPVVEGRIARVARAAAGRGRLFPIVIALQADDGIVPGMATEVVMTLPQDSQVSVPIAAVVDPTGNGASALVIEGDDAHGTVRRVPVEVTRLRGENALLRVGPGVGERVVIAGHSGLVDGETVEVVQ